jgi:arylsulfatase A-like enzyme
LAAPGGCLLAAALAAVVFAACRADRVERIDLVANREAADTVAETRRIDLGSLDEKTAFLLQKGWSFPEKVGSVSYVFADAQRASARFFSISGGATSLSFRADPIPSPDGKPQTVRLLVNGSEVAEQELRPGWRDYTVDLPAPRVRRGFNTLDLEFRYLHDPFPPDKRRLAVRFDFLDFGPSGAKVETAPPVGAADAAAELDLPPASGRVYLLRLPGRPVLEVGVRCPSTERRGANGWDLAFWLGTPGDDAEPQGLPADELCDGSADRASRRIPLGGDGREVRDLYVINRGPRPLVVTRLEVTGEAPAPPAKRWNAILVILDALRADHLHAFGYARQTSPHIDALAKDSTLFTKAFAQAGCTPLSMPSILTGLYPPEHGANDERALPPTIPLLAERFAASGYRTVAFSANPYVSSAFGLNRGFDEFGELFKSVADQQRGVDGVVRAESVLRAARDWLGRSGPQPFFMLLHFLQPHTPYAPPPPHWGIFGTPDPRRFDGREAMLRSALARGSKAARAIRPDVIDRYDENVLYADSAIGRLVQQLELLGLRDRTVLVVASDHGEGFLEHGHYSHLGSLYEEDVHVPLLVHLPDGSPAGRVDSLVQNLDIAPTLLELAGVSHAFGHGTSLVPSMRGSARAAPRAVFGFGKRESSAWEPLRLGLASVRTGRFKLIEIGNGHSYELFDLASDPVEQRNVAAQRADVIADLKVEIERELAVAGEPAPAARARLDEATRQRLRQLGYSSPEKKK